MPAKKYATPEEAKEAKRLKTLESNRRRREEKKANAPPKEPKPKKEPKAKEPKPKAPRKAKAKAETPAKSPRDDWNQEDIDWLDKEFESTPPSSPASSVDSLSWANEPEIPVRSGFHDLIAFLNQDHGEVVPAGKERPIPQNVVAVVDAINRKAHAENLEKVYERHKAVEPALIPLEPVFVKTSKIDENIEKAKQETLSKNARMLEERQKRRDAIVSKRVAKQAELREVKVRKKEEPIKWEGNSQWLHSDVTGASSPYPEDIWSVKDEPSITEVASVGRKTRFSQASEGERITNIARHIKENIRPNEHYGNLKPPVIPKRPALSLFAPENIQNLNHESRLEEGKRIQNLLNQEPKNEILDLILKKPKARTPKAKAPKPPTPKPPTPKPTPKPPTPKAPKAKARKKESELSAQDLADKKARRIHRLEKEFNNERTMKGNIEKKRAELAQLKSEIGELYRKANEERNEYTEAYMKKIGKVAPSKVVAERQAESERKGQAYKSSEIQRKEEEKIAKKVAAEEKKKNKALAKKGVSVFTLPTSPPKTFQQLQDERKLLNIQLKGSVYPTPAEEAFIKHFEKTYGHLPNLVKKKAELLGYK